MYQDNIQDLFLSSNDATIPVIITNTIPLDDLSEFQENWMIYQGISESLSEDQYVVMPNESGAIDRVYVGYNHNEPSFTLGEAYNTLPKGYYSLNKINSDSSFNPTTYQLLLGFALGAYQFNKYKKQSAKNVAFYCDDALLASLNNAVHAHYLVRNLINEPANSLTPDNFSSFIKAEFSELPVSIKEWAGDSLIKNNFPLIYTVGAGSRYKPRFIEIIYHSSDSARNITLVGKGVCFDTGGLDIKPSSGMRLMKKDMGGAAHMIALTKWMIQEELNVNLRLLLPIVENSVSSAAMRPGDIIKARNGLTVEVDNTDAEGRLILADALSYASEKGADLIINFATLTGAARVALGPEIPALFSNDDQLANRYEASGIAHDDLVCRLPLHAGYESWIKPNIADLANSASYPFGGAITAALFLQHFIDHENIPFAHIDVMAWNIRKRSGRPIGGEAMGLHATYHLLKEYLNEK